MDKLSKNARVMKFVCSHFGSGVARTRLIKLIYLADLEARKLSGSPISLFEYSWMDYGPFDHAYYSAESELLDHGLCEQKSVPLSPTMTEVKLVSAIDAPDLGLSLSEQHILRYVIQKFGRLHLPNLKAIAYKTPPMERAQENDAHSERLDVEMMDNQVQLGFDMEKILESEQRVKAGEWVSLGDFIEELQSEAWT